MKNSIVVFGPPACGKTRQSETIATYFGLGEIVDASDVKILPTFNTLILTPNKDIPTTLTKVDFAELVNLSIVRDLRAEEA